MAITKGLGKGVEILFGEEVTDNETFFHCDVEKIIPNQHQPRTHFNDEDLKELSDSIKENGIIQPLIVRNCNQDGNYELIAGERRLRASKLVGLESVPVVILNVEDNNISLELALIENIQRTDLNPIEEALAYSTLIKKFGYTQEQTAKKVGKKRATITNLLRLLNLPQFVKADIIQGMLSEGHARCLLRLGENHDSIKNVRDKIIADNLTVRQTEAFVKRLIYANSVVPSKNIERSTTAKEKSIPQSYCNTLVNQLTNKLNSKVKIIQNGSRGKLEIEYYSPDDLERLIDIVMGEK